ncbi:MAG: hypothetical protein GXP10_03355 [Gammaproteobacteria bacterium]|nr:hypothetical protein [Gammaproteobacteria bacterium]
MSIKATELFELISTLIDYNDEDWAILKEEGPQITQWAPELVSVFYDTLYGLEETKNIFCEGERPKLEKTLEDWIASIIAGDKGSEFWEHQWLIALLHVQRGVRNLYMLGIMNRVQQVILAKCMESYDQDKAHRVFSAFLRISGAVSALIAECYDEVIELSTTEGLSKVGVNPALLTRIKAMQIKKMLQEAR